MYSVVLMTALATSSAAPGFGHHCWGWRGCSGCYGCSCYGCTGCCGGGYWTYGSYGCAGAGFGYHGGAYGAFGNWYGDPRFGGCTGCYGCHGGLSGYGIPVPGVNPMAPPPATRETDIEPGPKKSGGELIKPNEVKSRLESPTQPYARVKVRIDVPEGGKLFVDGNQINVSAGARVFHTPPLAQGQQFFYDIRIEVERNGQTLSEQRRVIIQANEDVAVSFPNLRWRGAATARAGN